MNRYVPVYGVLVASTESEAVVKCDDGTRRSVKWTRMHKVGVYSRKLVHNVRLLDARDSWMLNRPFLEVAKWCGQETFEVKASHAGADALQRDLAAIAEWMSAKPAEQEGCP